MERFCARRVVKVVNEFKIRFNFRFAICELYDRTFVKIFYKAPSCSTIWNSTIISACAGSEPEGVL